MYLKNALKCTFDLDELFSPEGVCETYLEADINNLPERPLVIITGDNASGKSFFCNVIGTFLHVNDDEEGEKVLCMNFGMSRRTVSNVSRAFIYGDEQRESTGEISLHVVLGAIKNSKQYDVKHTILLDEPDIGLSEAFIPALSEVISKYYAELPDNADGLVIVTHNRVLVEKLMHFNPVCIRMGTRQNTKDWIKNGSPVKTVEELENLRKISSKKCSEIHKQLNLIKQEKREDNLQRNP